MIRRTYTTNRTTRFNLGIQWLLCLVVTSDLNSLVNNAHIHAGAHAHKHMQDECETVPDLSHFPAKIYIEKWAQHSDRLSVFFFFFILSFVHVFSAQWHIFVGVFTFSQLADTTDCTLCEAPLKCRQLSQAAKWNWFGFVSIRKCHKESHSLRKSRINKLVCDLWIDIEFSTRRSPASAQRRETLLIFEPVKWIGRSVATWNFSRRFQAPSNRIPYSCSFKNNRCWIENGVSIHIYSAATKIDLPIVRCAGEAVFIITTSRRNGRGRTRRTVDSRSINSRHKYTLICGMHHLLWRTRANVNIMPYDQKTSQRKLLLRDSSGDDDFTGANQTEKKNAMTSMLASIQTKAEHYSLQHCTMYIHSFHWYGQFLRASNVQIPTDECVESQRTLKKKICEIKSKEEEEANLNLNWCDARTSTCCNQFYFFFSSFLRLCLFSISVNQFSVSSQNLIRKQHVIACAHNHMIHISILFTKWTDILRRLKLICYKLL